MQLDRNTSSVENFLQNYSAHGFPPAGVASFLGLGLCVAGLAWLWRKQYRVLVLLAVGPLALGVMAAVVLQWPFWQELPLGPRVRNFLDLLSWLVMIHTGRMMAYPVGGDNGLCAGTLFLFVVGLVWLWPNHNRSLVCLCVGPFALGLVAALLHRYPYGGCCRLSEHVAPIICLAAGAGLASLFGRLRTIAQQRQAVAGTGTLFVVVGLTGPTIDVLYPYRGDSDVWMRNIVRHIAGSAARTIRSWCSTRSKRRTCSTSGSWPACATGPGGGLGRQRGHGPAQGAAPARCGC